MAGRAALRAHVRISAHSGQARVHRTIGLSGGAAVIGRIALGILAALLFILSGVDAKAAVVCNMSATAVDFGEVSRFSATALGAIVLSCIGNGQTEYVI